MFIKQFICAALFYSLPAIVLATCASPDHFMHALSADIKLRNLSLLGSHDAGTYDLDPDLGVSPDETGNFIQKLAQVPLIGDIAERTFIKSWSQAQNKNITSQLNKGVRYFDLRFAVDSKEEFRICHGLYGPLVDEILLQFKQFLNQHPQEIVFLDFQHIYDNDGNDMSLDNQILLIDKLKQYLGDLIAPASFEIDVTVGQMHQAKKQVIVFWQEAKTAVEFRELLWDRTTYLCSNWYNVNNWDDLLAALDQGLSNQTTSQFYVNQAILTPDTTMIITKLFSSLLSVGKKVNKPIKHWYKQKALEGNAGNILMIDNVASIYRQTFKTSWNYNKLLEANLDHK